MLEEASKLSSQKSPEVAVNHYNIVSQHRIMCAVLLEHQKLQCNRQQVTGQLCKFTAYKQWRCTVKRMLSMSNAQRNPYNSGNVN